MPRSSIVRVGSSGSGVVAAAWYALVCSVAVVAVMAVTRSRPGGRGRRTGARPGCSPSPRCARRRGRCGRRRGGGRGRPSPGRCRGRRRRRPGRRSRGRWGRGGTARRPGAIGCRGRPGSWRATGGGRRRGGPPTGRRGLGGGQADAPELLLLAEEGELILGPPGDAARPGQQQARLAEEVERDVGDRSLLFELGEAGYPLLEAVAVDQRVVAEGEAPAGEGVRVELRGHRRVDAGQRVGESGAEGPAVALVVVLREQVVRVVVGAGGVRRTGGGGGAGG